MPLTSGTSAKLILDLDLRKGSCASGRVFNELLWIVLDCDWTPKSSDASMKSNESVTSLPTISSTSRSFSLHRSVSSTTRASSCLARSSEASTRRVKTSSCAPRNVRMSSSVCRTSNLFSSWSSFEFWLLARDSTELVNLKISASRKLTRESRRSSRPSSRPSSSRKLDPAISVHTLALLLTATLLRLESTPGVATTEATTESMSSRRLFTDESSSFCCSWNLCVARPTATCNRDSNISTINRTLDFLMGATDTSSSLSLSRSSSTLASSSTASASLSYRSNLRDFLVSLSKARLGDTPGEAGKLFFAPSNHSATDSVSDILDGGNFSGVARDIFVFRRLPRRVSVSPSACMQSSAQTSESSESVRLKSCTWSE
mmetsp:Transcript_59853/g.159319  ORF Transcript_59853/g.159319 Transcript_59853/m.159319 type:complete len:374 (-) Transcript_59853:324-1445(-)